MNNNCPSCGALYNVASKDIGRRLKCKKCNSALTVTDAGLEMDDGGAPPEEARAEKDRDRDRDRDLRRDDDIDEEPRPKKKKRRDDGEPGVNPLTAIGGVPTILFAFGVFLVIIFVSFPIIGNKASDRAAAYKDRLETERDREKLDLQPKKPRSEWAESEKKKIEEETPKIESRYARLIDEAELEARRTRVSNVRDQWLESYGIMFGFMFVAFGCIGYLRTEQPLVLKIVAGVILTLMMLIMFTKFSGCAPPR